jgi:hypothetical protein
MSPILIYGTLLTYFYCEVHCEVLLLKTASRTFGKGSLIKDQSSGDALNIAGCKFSFVLVLNVSGRKFSYVWILQKKSLEFIGAITCKKIHRHDLK